MQQRSSGAVTAQQCSDSVSFSAVQHVWRAGGRAGGRVEQQQRTASWNVCRSCGGQVRQLLTLFTTATSCLPATESIDQGQH